MGIVYLIRNTVNDKVYVGQTINTLKRRWTGHTSDAKHNAGCKSIARAIRKYSRRAFDLAVLGEGEAGSELDNLERIWIILLRSTNPKFGYNRTSGGLGCAGIDSVRAKISAAAKSQWADPARRERAVAAMRASAAKRIAMMTPAERREKYSRDLRGSKNPAFGKPGTRLGCKASQQQRARSSESNKRYWRELPPTELARRAAILADMRSRKKGGTSTRGTTSRNIL